MLSIDTIDDLRDQIDRWRVQGNRIGFVPTMGNLHAGHLRLIQQAHQYADKIVCSIFINPMQFSSGEDLDNYPQTLAEDKSALAEENTDLVFTPSVEAVYPRELEERTYVEVPRLGKLLCGPFRPGHFRGVSTVVNRLFNLVRPDVAVFGKKDYQQLKIIQQMVQDLGMSISIIGVDTVREQDGLAMSSRNGYLSKKEREQAPGLYASLQQTREALLAGRRDYSDLECEGEKRLLEQGFKPGYYRIMRQQDLGNPDPDEKNLVILVAASLGRARLIDNLEFHCQQRTKTG